MNITATSMATLSNNAFVMRRYKIADHACNFHRLGIKFFNKSAYRHIQNHICAVTTVLACALTVSSSFRAKMVLETIGNKGRYLGICAKNNIAAPSSISPIGPTFGNERFAAKRHTSSSPIATFAIDATNIGKGTRGHEFSLNNAKLQRRFRNGRTQAHTRARPVHYTLALTTSLRNSCLRQ